MNGSVEKLSVYSRSVQPKFVSGPQFYFFRLIWAAICQKLREKCPKCRYFFKILIQFGPHKNVSGSQVGRPWFRKLKIRNVPHSLFKFFHSIEPLLWEVFFLLSKFFPRQNSLFQDTKKKFGGRKKLLCKWTSSFFGYSNSSCQT
jgi:hypothetical protein